MRWKIPLILATTFFFLGWADLVFGFGVSPPWVQADHLIPGSHYEQDIYISQPPPASALKIEVAIDAPEISQWIQIKPGNIFEMPAVLNYPMRVIIDVPKDAGYDIYQGKIRVRAVSGNEGQVAVLSGAIIDVRLGVSGEEFSDFQVKEFRVKDIEEDWPVKVYLKLENLGNVKVRPSEVKLEVYDLYNSQLLQRGGTKKMDWVGPFQTGEIIAEFPTKLALGEYWANVEIFKKGEQVLKDKRIFHIVKKGSIKPYPVFLGISVYNWLGIIFGILVLAIGFKFDFWKKITKKILKKFGISITIRRAR